MKKKILSIILILALSFGVFTAVSAFAAEDKATGSVKTGDTTLEAVDGKYYTNSAFVYETEAEVKFKAFDIDAEIPATGEELAAVAEDYDASVALEENKAYAFVEIKDSAYSQVVVVVYDTEAPIIDNAKLMAAINEDSVFGLERVPASKTLKLPTDWAKDPAILQGVDTADNENDEKSYTVKFEYKSPSTSTWATETDSISATTVGSWTFRYVVSDLAGNTVTSNEFRRVIFDDDAPVLTFTSTQEKWNKDGVTAGTAFSITNPTSSDISSSVTVTYVVMKLVKGEWTTIYDSATKTVTEGYEDYITTSGRLTPAADELSTDDVPYLYKVVYSAVDAEGHKGEDVTLEIKTVKAEEEETEQQKTNNTWQVILIIVAVLAAVALVVVIFFVKPENKEETGRVHYGDKNSDKK